MGDWCSQNWRIKNENVSFCSLPTLIQKSMIVSDAKGFLSILQWHLLTETEPLALETWKAHIRSSGYGIQAGSMEWQITTLTPISLFQTLIILDFVNPKLLGLDVQQICSSYLLYRDICTFQVFQKFRQLKKSPKSLGNFQKFRQLFSFRFSSCFHCNYEQLMDL